MTVISSDLVLMAFLVLLGLEALAMAYIRYETASEHRLKLHRELRRVQQKRLSRYCHSQLQL